MKLLWILLTIACVAAAVYINVWFWVVVIKAIGWTPLLKATGLGMIFGALAGMSFVQVTQS